MYRVVILYPKTEDSYFKMDYYLGHHIPLVRDIFKGMSLTQVQVDEGMVGGMPDQPPSFASISHFTFEKLEDFQAGMAARGNEILADLPNYTNVQPQVQINRVMAT